MPPQSSGVPLWQLGAHEACLARLIHLDTTCQIARGVRSAVTVIIDRQDEGWRGNSLDRDVLRVTGKLRVVEEPVAAGADRHYAFQDVLHAPLFALRRLVDERWIGREDGADQRRGLQQQPEHQVGAERGQYNALPAPRRREHGPAPRWLGRRAPHFSQGKASACSSSSWSAIGRIRRKPSRSCRAKSDPTRPRHWFLQGGRRFCFLPAGRSRRQRSGCRFSSQAVLRERVTRAGAIR
jgi:hypothetical protein